MFLAHGIKDSDVLAAAHLFLEKLIKLKDLTQAMEEIPQGNDLVGKYVQVRSLMNDRVFNGIVREYDPERKEAYSIEVVAVTFFQSQEMPIPRNDFFIRNKLRELYYGKDEQVLKNVNGWRIVGPEDIPKNLEQTVSETHPTAQN